MAPYRDGIGETMKEQIKRFYDLDFEQLKKDLKLKGEFLAYQVSKNSSVLQIITEEIEEKNEPK